MDTLNYPIFDIDEDMTENDLKLQYAKLIKQFRPTTHPEEFQQIKNAFKVAKNTLHKRKESKDIEQDAIVEKMGKSVENVFIMSEEKDCYRPKDNLNDRIKDFRVESESISLLIVKSKMTNTPIYMNFIFDFFTSSRHLYTDILEFYVLFREIINIDELTLYINNKANYSVKYAWNAFLASNTVANRNRKRIVSIREEEKKFFTESENRMKTFLNILNSCGFSSKFNYLDEELLHSIEENHNSDFLKYLGTMDAKFLVYYNSVYANILIFRNLDESRKAEFLTYFLSLLREDEISQPLVYEFCMEYGEHFAAEYIKDTGNNSSSKQNLSLIEEIAIINYSRIVGREIENVSEEAMYLSNSIRDMQNNSSTKKNDEDFTFREFLEAIFDKSNIPYVLGVVVFLLFLLALG